MEEQKTNEQMEGQSISVEDALLVIDIFKKALGFRPFIKKAILGQEFLELSKEERLNETLTPRIALHYADDEGKIPCLFFRFVGTESPIVEAIFYPIEAIHSFLMEARSYIRWYSPPERPNEEIEAIAFDKTVDMALIMIDSFYQRANLMMDSFTEEVIAQWHINNDKKILHYYAEQGDQLPYRKNIALEKAIKDYSKSVSQFWKFQGQTYENWQKIRLAEAYEGISKHWKWLSKMSREDMDWRDYATTNKFQDTPDDLLDKLENADRLDSNSVETKVSELALEHAARRVRLIKKRGVSESVNNQRKKGIKVTGYTSGQLFNLLKEGRELIEQAKANGKAFTQESLPNSVEPNGHSAQVKKIESFEQKIQFIKANSGKLDEQKDDSAQEEKT